MSELEWAAGFFDGEGHISFSQRKLHMTVGQSNSKWEPRGIPFVLIRFKNAIEIGDIHGPTTEGDGNFPRYVWRISCNGAVIAFNKLALGLSPVKLQQGKESIDNWENRPSRRLVGTEKHCPQGHERTKENTYFDTSGYARCKLCHRASNRKNPMERISDKS